MQRECLFECDVTCLSFPVPAQRATLPLNYVKYFFILLTSLCSAVSGTGSGPVLVPVPAPALVLVPVPVLVLVLSYAN